MANSERLLQLALRGLEAEIQKIDDEIAQIRSQLAAVPGGAMRVGIVGVSSTQPRKRRSMSAAARKRISLGMKRRWAERGGSAPVQKAQVQKTAKSQRGGLTAAGRKKLSEMMTARWAAKRKASKKAA
jgi:hypothetical protein